MDEIAELERRITAALERISKGMEERPSASGGPSPVVLAELDRLREELDDERTANYQLTERLKQQRARAERTLDEIREEAARLTAQVDEQALAMQRLVNSNVQMREELRRLREATERGGTVDAALIDKALAAELEAYRATAEAETAELADLIAALTPIVEAEEARADA